MILLNIVDDTLWLHINEGHNFKSEKAMVCIQSMSTDQIYYRDMKDVMDNFIPWLGN